MEVWKYFLSPLLFILESLLACFVCKGSAEFECVRERILLDNSRKVCMQLDT